MENNRIKVSQFKGVSIAEIYSNKLEISNVQDVLDIIANSDYLGSNKIILHERNIISDFFDLKTGLAGEVLQKFSTYRVQLAIIGDFSKYSSKSLSDFIFESNKYKQVVFVSSDQEAKEKLAKR